MLKDANGIVLIKLQANRLVSNTIHGKQLFIELPVCMTIINDNIWLFKISCHASWCSWSILLFSQ